MEDIVNVKDMIKDLRENIEKTANVKAVFGDEKKIDDISIIPVASIRMKGGSGGGIGTAGEPKDMETEEAEKATEETEEKKEAHHPSATGKGGGLGLDVEANPVGYIEIKDNRTRFVEILDKSKMILKIIRIFGIVIILMAVKGFFKKKKKK